MRLSIAVVLRAFLKQILLVYIIIPNYMCSDIRQEHFAVQFSPYVKLPDESGKTPSLFSYTKENVKTALEVVSRKFSRVVTTEIGALTDKYVKEFTYNHASFANAFTAEAAAMTNLERNLTFVRVVVGLHPRTTIEDMQVEVAVALEAIAIANAIFPGTVEAILFFGNDEGSDVTVFNQTLGFLKELRRDDSLVDIKLGARIQCSGFASQENNMNYQITHEIVNASEFVVCDLAPALDLPPENAAKKFQQLGYEFLEWRDEVKRFHSNVDVWMRTQWPDPQVETAYTIDRRRQYWESANEWSERKNVAVVMLEAFDEPYLSSLGSGADLGGWWRLTNNSLINSIDGYVEKVTDLMQSNKTTPFENFTHAEDATTIITPLTISGIVIGSIAVLALTIITVVCGVRCTKNWHNNGNRQQRMETSNKNNNGEHHKRRQHFTSLETVLNRPYDSSYEIPKEKLIIESDKLLGTGQFGRVFQATIQGAHENITVALKMTRNDVSTSDINNLLSEIKILAYLGKHENIVAMVGGYTAELENGVLYLVTELCSLGSLEGYLRTELAQNCSTDDYAYTPARNPNNVANLDDDYLDMIRWSHEIACGMEFLGTKHVVHADLATRNVLLTANKTAKITDFGLSRKLYEYEQYIKTKQEPIPWRWMAIESLKRAEFSTQSDVWSYGVTLWEIFTKGDIPYPGLSWNLNFVHLLVGGLTLEHPPFASENIYILMKQCWHINPKDRMSFRALQRRMMDILDNVVEIRKRKQSSKSNLHSDSMYPSPDI